MLNNNGYVAGWYDAQSGSVNGFMYSGGSNGTFTTLDVPGAQWTSAAGINNSGQVVGTYADAGGAYHGFLYSNGTYTTIDDLAGKNTQLTGINNSGAIVGFYQDLSEGRDQSFLYSGGTFTPVSDPLGINGETAAQGINDQNQIVGWYYNGNEIGFVASPSVMTVASGAALTIGTPFSGNVTFAGSTGTLTLNDVAGFHGSIGGQLASSDLIDLTGITAGAAASVSYTGNNSPGTLTISDGTNSVAIAMLGNYSLANFTPSNDLHGGTVIM